MNENSQSYHVDISLDDIKDVMVEERFDENETNGVAIDGPDDYVKVDPMTLTEDGFMSLHFPDVEVAYEFYNWYGQKKGFSARKNKVRRNKNRDMIEKIFLCHREGLRKKKEDDDVDTTACGDVKPVREARPETRTRCLAKMKVHVDTESGCWHVTKICDDHNHKLLDGKYSGMLPAHRKLSNADVM
ncbi:FAR1 DNA-binding domain [Sesbania bispinosa]|nr:FAR1 DNA-binding domain [Sesbania bispinosa]